MRKTPPRLSIRGGVFYLKACGIVWSSFHEGHFGCKHEEQCMSMRATLFQGENECVSV